MSAANAAPADWPQDIPFYKWPPFPAKPDGVTITPFSQFVATGLKDDQDEDAPGVDQMGIPTVVLEARHDGEKKKRRKKKKGENGETIEVPLDWWEEFEEDAKNPRRLYKYNHDEPYMARLEQAWKDFTDNRRFPSHVLTVAQDLGEFLGLVKPKPKADKSAKKAGDDTNNDANDADNNAETANDSGDMSDDEPSPDEPVSAEKTGEAGDILESKIEEVPDPDVEKAKAEKKAKEQLQAAIERAIKAEIEREKALDAFYQDSEQVMKLYLTSHAYDRGIYWNDAKLRDTPVLVETFLNFLESNSVFGPKEEDVKHRMARAKKVAQLAKQEMPHANKVARLFPDAWGMACADIWGKSIVGEWVFGQPPGEPQDAVSDEASTTSPTMTTAQTTPEIHDELPIDPVHGDGIIFEPTEAELLVDSIEPPSINGHQTEWTHAGDGDAPGEEPPTWDANVEQFKEPPPEDPANVWGNLGPSGREQLETLIGRNNLPETYVTIRAESSSRIISSIIEPTPNPAANLEGASFAEIAQQRLARLTLSPSPYSKTAPEIGACINQPIMHNPPIDESKFGWVGPHDPLASDITLFVQSDAEFLETLRAGARMVVTGVFVQVAEITSPKDDEKEGKEAQAVGGEQPKKKKKKSKSAAADVRSWWFFSQMGEVYPTFFTE